MKLSVTPREIAEQLVKEVGHHEAIAEYRYRLSRCNDAETAGIWRSIGLALEGMTPLAQAS